MRLADYNNEFGDMDLFLLDLLLKGYVEEEEPVLDAGCGSGRNTFFFLKQGYTVHAIDNNKNEVTATNFMSRSLGRGEVAVLGNLRELPFANSQFGLVVCSRTLHFAESESDFHKMIEELHRVLRRGGVLYISMNSAIANVEEQKKSPIATESRVLLTTEMIAGLSKGFKKLLDTRTVFFEAKHQETTIILVKD
jgi:SAM-dependent methyltransferase